ncbi:6-phosphogluconolactonase [Thiolinea disciformis]|uniref:6-phosphogluconolactonase n=1 Tax=Thiolinea disciformis TaxID=125614 RepID=UPI00036E2273|nr:6-phosphogluconolactonase [Thiolinea disciformis]
MTRLQTWPDRASQAKGLAALVAQELGQALRLKPSASFAVPGGTTPAPFMQALAQHALDWSRLTVTLTDERQVPPEHERSNALLLRENLLQFVPDLRFIPLYETGAIQQISERLTQQVLPFTTCVLGMGTDGHFASLFPQAKQLALGLDLQQPQALLVMEAPNIPETRLSLSLAALLSAKSLHLLISGAEKLAVWQQALARVEQQQRVLPIDYLLAEAGDKLVTHYAP